MASASLEVLDRRPIHQTTGEVVRRSVSVGGRRISYLGMEPAATGPVIVMIHGSGMSARAWVEQIRGLASTARALALDLPGHGRSDDVPCASIDDYAAITAGFVAALGLPPVILAGHSLGGAVALALAARRPTAVAGVVLVSTCARLPAMERPAVWISFLPWAVRRVVILTAAKKFLFGPGASGHAVGIGMQELWACRSDVLARDVAIARAMDLTRSAAALRVPSLIVCGSGDRLTPLALSRELHELIADSRLDVVDGAGHMLLAEAPGAVNEKIAAFADAVVHEQRWAARDATRAPGRVLSRWRRHLRRLRALLRLD